MKKINFKKVFSGRNVVFSLLILAVVFLFGDLAFAGFGEWAGNVVGGIIGVFITAVAGILMLLVRVLMDVAAYSDFINAPAITKGWVVVRDVCNMFFVVILLIIAFATILGQEEYGAKKMLPKLVMAAILINFSKMFCGLMIDVASVVMLTFVNAFSAIGSGNMLDLLGISTITSINPDSATITFGTIVSSYIFGLIYVLIATVVVASMLGMLVMRVVMIWILVVLSPLAFFLQAVPGKGAQYASQWWTKWSSNLIVGPVIAFFLWLSFAALQGGSPITSTVDTDAQNFLNKNITASTTEGIGSEAGTVSQMAKFVIAIGMLLGGMKIAQEVGGETGAALGKGMNQISKGKALALGAVTGAAVGTSKFIGRKTLLGAGAGINQFSGTDANGKKKGNLAGKFMLGWQTDLENTAKKNRKAAAAKYLGKMGIGEKGSEAGQTLINSKGFQNTIGAAKGAALGMALGGPAGLAIALGSGTIGGSAFGLANNYRSNAKNGVKSYEGSQGEYNKAQAAHSKAQAEKNKYDGHQTFVSEFDSNQAEFDALEARGGGQVGAANKLSVAERMVFAQKSKYLKDKKNTDKYDEGKDYLSKNNLNDKEQAIISADQAVQDQKNIIDNGKDKYNSDKKIVKRTGFLENFEDTKAAMADMAKKQQQAKEWTKIAASDPEYLENIGGKGNIYSSAGASDTWKRRLDELNGGGGFSGQAISNFVSEINNDKVANPKMEEFAKLLAAYKKGGGSVNSTTLGQIENALSNKGFNSATYDGKVTTQYKQLGSYVEDVKDGSGSLQFDSFARNSAKPSGQRQEAKDIMGVSFDKLNSKLGADYKLDSAAGVNQKVGGAQLGELSKAMSSLIDDEIKSLQKVGGDISTQKIDQLTTAKKRLDSGDVSGLSLKNTDVVYKGATDSERRQAEYNTTQHELIHQAGAKNEAVVDKSAGELQQNKLIGNVPNSGGQRYDEVVGKMIASMEKSGASESAMSQAVASQIEKWKTTNVQRVVETQKGERETVSDSLPGSEKSGEALEKTVEAIDKLNDSLNKPVKSFGGAQSNAKDLSISDKNFFRTMFGGLKKVITKDDNILGEKLSPLAAMAAHDEKGKNV